MATELWQQSAIDLAAAIRNQDVNATEVLEAHLARIAATNPKINAIVTLSEEVARAQAGAPGPVPGRGACLRDGGACAPGGRGARNK